METSARAVPEAHHADIGDGLQIHYQEQGAGDKVILFIHGSGPGASGYSNFKGNYPFFAEHGFRAVVPDTLGFGYSSKPADVDYELDFLAGALSRFVDALGIERCAVVGNSHGGALALQLALNRPALVERLVLMAPGGLEVRETYMKMAGITTMMKVFFSKEGITRDGMRQVFGLQLYDPDTLTEATLDERMEIAALQPKRVLASLRVPYLSPRLGELECPVFGLWGTCDQFCPVSGARALYEHCADARVLVLPRCGHWVMVERAELFNRLCLDFLEQRL